MTTFDKRQDGFEKKFAMDEELRFRVGARRNKLLGRWAAEKMGLAGAQADEYALSVVAADFDRAGEEDVFEKVRDDLDAKGAGLSEAQIRAAMSQTMAEAKRQLMDELQA